MKNIFEIPSIEFIKFSQDVIVTSGFELPDQNLDTDIPEL